MPGWGAGVAQVVVVGGGLGGLATALFAARRGHDVVVVDRDPGPPGGDADSLAAWDRRGVAQAGFSHYFLARSTRVLRDEVPDLVDELARVGVGESAVRFGEGYETDRALVARRLVYEATLRHAVQRDPAVEVVHGSVRSLVVDAHDPTRVVGVQVDGPREVRGDLVVDAGGRRSASGRWMRSQGLPAPSVYEEPVDRHYYCRHYRLRDGESFPSLEVPIVQPLPYGTVLLFLGDSRTYSVAVALSARDPLGGRLRRPEVFDRFLAALPMTAGWQARSEPLGDLHLMAGLSNRRRRLAPGGRPVVSGLALVGDSALYTNPTLGQGVSLTFWMASALAGLVETFRDRPSEALVAYEAWLDTHLDPHFAEQLRVERESRRQVQAGLRGDGFVAPAERQTRVLGAVMELAAEDEDLRDRAQRVRHLLESPAALLADETLVARVGEVLSRGRPAVTGEGPLPRAAFEAIVAG